MSTAIAEAIRAASPVAAANTSSSSSTSRPTAATPESLLIRCAEKMLNAVDLDLPAVDPSVARILTFDGTPRSASSNRPTHTADHAVHQLVGRTGFPIFMTMQQLNRAAENPTGEVSTVFACFRDTDKKNVTTTLLSNTPPPSTWTQVTVEKGMSDSCIESVMSWLDVPLDMLECIKAALSGRLVIVTDDSISPEDQKICMQYMRIFQSQLEFGYNPLVVAMNRFVSDLPSTLLYAPASIMCLKDRHISTKLLSALPSATHMHLLSGKPEDTPLTVPHLLMQCMRFNYKPTKDDPRKTRVAMAFLRPLHEHMTYDQFFAHWTRIKREYRQLKSRDVHANDPTEERECILLLLQHRSWMNSFKKRWQEKGWPDTTAQLFAKLKHEMNNEESGQEKHRYSSMQRKAVGAVLQQDNFGGIDHDDELSHINAIGAKDFKKTQNKNKRPLSAPPYERRDNRDGRDSRDGRDAADRRRDDRLHRGRDRDKRDRDRPRDDSRAPTKYRSTTDDRRFHVSTGSAPPTERRRDYTDARTMRKNRQHVMRTGIGGQHKDSGQTEGTRYLLGRTNPAPPGWHCPGCKNSKCVGRCPVCLAENSCAASHRNNCPYRHSKFSDPTSWDRTWFRDRQHEPCMRCGNVGHPYSACPEKDRRQVLARTVMHEGRHKNAIVAFLTLKEGHAPPADDSDVDALREAYHIEYSDGCRDHSNCGHAHELDVAHVYTPDMRIGMDATCMPSSVYATLSQEYGTEMEFKDDVSDDGHVRGESTGEESEASSIMPIFAFDSLEHDTHDASIDIVAHTISDDTDLGAIWDTGAMRSVNRTEVGATGYVKQSTAQLRSADGGIMANTGEADFEALHQTRQGPPHTMTRNAPICPKAPVNIISAGEKFRQGYGAAHNLDGIYIPKGSKTYNVVRSLLRRNDRYLEFHRDEHQVVTPDLKQIMLVQKKPNLFFLEPMRATSVSESEHLKDVRKQDPRYKNTHIVSMLDVEDEIQQQSERITHDKGLEYYVTTAQALIGQVERLHRDLAFASARDAALSDALVTAVHNMHNVYEQLVSTHEKHDDSMRQSIERMHPSGLHTVCTRCEQPISEQEKDCGGAAECRNTCRECKSTVQGKHLPGYSCGKRCAASNTISVLKQQTRDAVLTGAVSIEHEQDDVHADNMQAHRDMHKDCDKQPCSACRQHKAQHAQTSGESLQSSSDIVARISDDAILIAFQSLQVSNQQRVLPSATEVRTTNEAGVCNTCRHHHTSCRCSHALTGKHSNTYGRCVHKACNRWAAYKGVGKICKVCDPKPHLACNKCTHLHEWQREQATDRDTDRAYTSTEHDVHVHAHQHRAGESEEDVIGRWVGRAASGGIAHPHAYTHIDHVMPVTRSAARTATAPKSSLAARSATADNKPSLAARSATADTKHSLAARSATADTRSHAVRTASAHTSSLAARSATADLDHPVARHTPTTRSGRPASADIDHPASTPATASLEHDEHAIEPPRPTAASTSTSASADDQVVKRGKRKEADVSLDRKSMMSIIGKHAWQSVLEDTSMFPTVLSFTPEEWLMQLPDDLRNALAVMHQNKVAARLKHEVAVMSHGQDSAQALEASAKSMSEHRAYMEAAAFMSRVAETMLTSATNE